MLMTKYQGFIKDRFTPQGSSLPDELLIEKQGDITVFYAPFDHVKKGAKVFICGLTPGASQANIALARAQKALREGAAPEEADRLAKNTASFAGRMRDNLVNMMDYLDIHQWLGVTTCAELFSDKAEHLAHYTSALRYPVFFKGRNYGGKSPDMLRNPLMRKIVETYLVEELEHFDDNTLLIPLGGSAEEALKHAAALAGLSHKQILSGMPHPSPASSERIAYFLGNKEREALSIKTNPDKIDIGKARAQAIVQQLPVL